MTSEKHATIAPRSIGATTSIRMMRFLQRVGGEASLIIWNRRKRKTKKQ